MRKSKHTKRQLILKDQRAWENKVSQWEMERGMTTNVISMSAFKQRRRVLNPNELDYDYANDPNRIG